MATNNRIVTKQELVTRIERGRGEFLSALADVSETEMTRPKTVGDWSISDLIAHVIAHEQHALAELQAALRGEVYAINHETNDTFDAGAVSCFYGHSFSQVRVAWLASTDNVIAAVEQLTPEEYDSAGSVCAILEDSIDGALGNNTYGHYAEHLPEVQAWLRARI